MKTKVFCIGFHKTGTTTLDLALRELGYSVTGPNGVNDANISSNILKMAHELAEQYDAFQDNPWPLVYKEMDEKYPDSKFILTERDESKWISSQVRHFGKNSTPMRQFIYGVGCPKGNEQVYLERYRQHYKEVTEYFKGRENSLLRIDLEKGHGWKELCDFLNVEIPTIPFPHANKASEREKSKTGLTAKLKRLLS